MSRFLRPGAVIFAVVLALIAALPFASSSSPEPGHYFFEIVLTSSIDGNVQVYYDLGHGFNEANSCRHPLHAQRAPEIYRFDLPTGTYWQLRFDPIDREGVVTLANARIVDRDGRVVRQFTSAQLQPIQQIASLTQKDGGIEVRTTAGANDPYLFLASDRPFELTSRFALWHRIMAALSAFVLAFLTALAMSSLLPWFRKVAAWQPARAGAWLATAAVALVLFKLWLTSAQTICAIGGSIVDDEMFVNLADSLLRGEWLGPYSQFTLAKGPMYSIFMAGVFLLGVPLFAAQQVLYAAACALLTRALRPLVASRGLRFGLFAGLLFNPITYNGVVSMRVQRQDILPALVLLIIAGLVAMYARRTAPLRRLVPWAVLTGIAWAAFWLTREEAAWLLPCAALLWGTVALAVWRDRAPDRRPKLLLLVLPPVLWGGVVTLVATINLGYYGVFTTCECKQAEFKDAFGAMLRVVPNKKIPLTPITRDVRERLYAVSPAFAELRPVLDGPQGEGWAEMCGAFTHLPKTEREIPLGWLMWATRDAVAITGHGRSGADAMAFYARMAREINEACDHGVLPAGPRHSGLMPPLMSEHVAPFLAGFRRAAQLFLSFDQMTSSSPPSSGPSDRLRRFADLTRGRLNPAPGMPAIPPTQRWLDHVRLGILNGISWVYSFAAPWLGAAALIGLLATIGATFIRRRISYFAVLSLAACSSVLALLSIDALIDATSFPAITISYFTGAYGLWLLAVFAIWYGLIEIWGIGSASSLPASSARLVDRYPKLGAIQDWLASQVYRAQIVRRITPHAVFLTLSLSFGLGLLLFNPPFQAPDEYEHFFRVVQLSEGTIIGQKQGLRAGGEIPGPINGVASPGDLPGHPERKVTRAYFADKLNPAWVRWDTAPRAFAPFPHTVVYSPLGYLPQTFAVFLGRLLHVGPLGLMYLARLSGFLASLGLGYAALTRLPICRWSMLLLLVAPITLYFMGSVAPDGLLITGSALLVSLLVRLEVEPARQLEWKEKTVILAIATLLPMAKFVFLPLAVIPLFVVCPRLRPGRDRVGFIVAWMLVCFLPVLAWTRVIVSVYVPGRGDIPIDPGAQIYYLASHPFAFLALVARTMVVQACDTYHQLVGVLGWNDTFMPGWFYRLFGCGLLACLVLESHRVAEIGRRTRLVMVGAGIASILLVYTALYIHWNAPGSATPIEGLMGRHLLPIFPALLFGFPAVKGFRDSEPLVIFLGSTLAILSSAVCCWALIERYYLP